MKHFFIALSARVIGAISNVIPAITINTGTADERGPSECSGRFQQHHLLNFSVEQLLSLRFSDLNNDATTNVAA